jgi:hypothetical protein
MTKIKNSKQYDLEDRTFEFARSFKLTARRTQTVADFLIARPAVAKAMARQARAIKRYVIPLARDKKLAYVRFKTNKQNF